MDPDPGLLSGSADVARWIPSAVRGASGIRLHPWLDLQYGDYQVTGCFKNDFGWFNQECVYVSRFAFQIFTHRFSAKEAKCTVTSWLGLKQHLNTRQLDNVTCQSWPQEAEEAQQLSSHCSLLRHLCRLFGRPCISIPVFVVARLCNQIVW